MLANPRLIERSTYAGLPPANPAAIGWLTTALRRVRLAIEVARERRELADMAPERLRDLGLRPAQARAEAERAPWDLPAGRL